MKKENKKFILKNKIINSFMSDGRKETCEKNLIKTLKNIQKLNTKNCTHMLQLFIANLTPVFKFNTQSKKRGKKKNVVFTPYLIPSNALRVSFALKLLKRTLFKNKTDNFPQKLAQEILTGISSHKSLSIEKKNEIQQQVLAQKRYFYKFRWYT